MGVGEGSTTAEITTKTAASRSRVRSPTVPYGGNNTHATKRSCVRAARKISPDWSQKIILGTSGDFSSEQLQFLLL